ncbi:2-amino-4-hydroxy-6-hydroxymethyldihydropteridine diphosphokinase [Acidiphilium sp. C61]|jgi:2-amino-4-hydroxy-6-hydroxymethyldihydropteridine diphosphokinase|uniref:2-amino-4-hydroxy-6- hydroxymethyldihydropteridine diphosphokinase n=1 Tax=Acidiphilium sp. C61 TaxID=1671485 RepID=UPI00157A312B|nr:2-amino-4-hydroxy-6-hydroxymethyldihydropteridine diphosphokinase [Acidiphilium sp. C61]
MILVALGANLSFAESVSPYDTCFRALEDVVKIPNICFDAASGWYRTSPVPPDPSQPDYCNGVARFSGTPDPADLLAALHRIEDAFGRTRSVLNAARTLDLDLIDVNGIVRNAVPPILPHPRAHLRGFVLRPLLDVAPDWVHPVIKSSAAELLAALPAEEMRGISRW